MQDNNPLASREQLERLFSSRRLSAYVVQCNGDFDGAIRLYRWNAAITAAFWEPIGHFEVALRNALSAQLADRHRRLRTAGSWLDDPNCDLTARSRNHIATARLRVRQKGKRASEDQTISELGFGFWRFLITKRLTGLWPDLADAFPGAPDRRRETVEEPLARLHVFRNRLAHHQRVWNRDPRGRLEDLMALAGYIDPSLRVWIASTCAVQETLERHPLRPP